jgi:hypothetical protein
MPKIIPQVIGFIAVATFLLSYQMKERRNIIIVNVISRVLYIVQYLLLGAFSGAILDSIGIISSVIAEKKNVPFIKKHTKLIIILCGAVVLTAGLSIAIVNKSLLTFCLLQVWFCITEHFGLQTRKLYERCPLQVHPFGLCTIF